MSAVIERAGPARSRRATAIMRKLPTPPAECLTDTPERFVPSSELWTWIAEKFLDPASPLCNPDHEHLTQASVGVLWTNVAQVSKQRQVIGTAEVPHTMGGRWKRARAELQLREWFGQVPDFIITLYAPVIASLDDRSVCAIIEHELYHCAQALDDFGNPKFTKDGRPLFAIRGHDVEEFVGVVRRYGVTRDEIRELVTAAAARPLIGDAAIAGCCGTCSAKVA